MRAGSAMERDYRAIERVLVITFVFNTLATAVKLGVGLWTGALSLIADGLDSLFDGLSNIVGVVAVRVSSQPADREHPYGHRKFETLAALFIAGALFLTVWELAASAVARLWQPVTPVVNVWTVGALLFGMTVQGLTGWWELRQGRRLASEVLLADARHTLASLVVSATVLVGLALVWLGYPRADPIVTLIVAGFIAKIGVDIVRDNVPALVDRAPLDETSIARVVDQVQGVESFHRIRSRGPVDSVAVDLHVRVAPHLSIQDANAIADEVRRRLLALPGVDDVTVHAEAQRTSESALDLYTSVKLAAQELGVSVHELWVHEVDQKLHLHLHVGVEPTLTLEQAHDRVDQLEQEILVRQPQLGGVYSHIELANSDVLPSARVSRGLHERIAAAIVDAADAIPDLHDPHAIEVRQVEGRLFVTVEALVDGNRSVAEAHELSTRLQESVRASVPNVAEVLVHLEPEKAQRDDKMTR